MSADEMLAYAVLAGVPSVIFGSFTGLIVRSFRGYRAGTLAFLSVASLTWLWLAATIVYEGGIR